MAFDYNKVSNAVFFRRPTETTFNPKALPSRDIYCDNSGDCERDDDDDRFRLDPPEEEMSEQDPGSLSTLLGIARTDSPSHCAPSASVHKAS